jgi:branched-chain amino acid transport system permease protein
MARGQLKPADRLVPAGARDAGRGLRRPLALLAILAGIILILAVPFPALAEGETMRGTLAYGTGDERTPVEGVSITVSQDGDEIGAVVSDADGAWEVALPGPGSYQVTLDPATLPDGVQLTDPRRCELPNVAVLGGQQKVVLFPLEEGPGGADRCEGGGGGNGGNGGGGRPGGGGGGISPYARVGGLLVAGLKLGATIALAAVGLSLIYAVTRLVNFAHAELVTLGAVLAFAFHVAGGGFPLVLAAIPAILLVSAFGWLQSRYLWLPLRRRRTSLLSMMVVSIGLSFALRGLIQLFFGGQPISYQDFAGQPGIPILGISMVPKHLVTIGVAILVLLLVTQFLERSRAGTAMRAVADDRDLAASSGIDVDRVIDLTWILAAGLAALGGIFYGLNESVSYDMGFRILLLLFAAVVLGGLGTAYGVMAGAFIVGIVVELSTLVLPSELKVVSGLLILIVMLLVRPQGLFGTRERIG